MCDFSTGFKPPEMVKYRPVVVISSRRDKKLCTVIPLSTTAPNPIENYHFLITPDSLPDKLSDKTTWAKCDMIVTVSVDRLDRVKDGKDHRTGKRLYSSKHVTPEDFKAIQICVLNALGFHLLTKML